MPNALAYLTLMIWPLVCAAMFVRLPLERAMVWSILGGYLLLPELAEFDLPLVPSMDKSSIPSIAAFVLCVFVLGRKVALLPKSWAARVLILVFVLGVVPTVLTNFDPIVFRSLANAEAIAVRTDTLPGLSLRDLVSVVAGQVIVLLPFLLARQYLSTETGLREVLVALFAAGLAYSIPALVEVRLSPQLNTWIYGFFQHDFRQMMRDGGFRPIVFLPHGLWLALFMVMSVLAAAALARTAPALRRAQFLGALLYLLVLLVLCKSLAALAYGLIFTPVVLFASPRTQIRIAMLCAAVAVIYPMLRNAGVLPVETIVAIATDIDPERAQSLSFRLDNEERLLARAAERPWFGWGIWGRNLVHDLRTGAIVTIPDGRWIIVFGMFGWVGYLAEMGLLALPLILLGLRAGRMRPDATALRVATIAMILAVTMIDMLLNATLIPFTWICAGAVLGYAERLRRLAPDADRGGAFDGGPVIGRTGTPHPGGPVL